MTTHMALHPSVFDLAELRTQHGCERTHGQTGIAAGFNGSIISYIYSYIPTYMYNNFRSWPQKKGYLTYHIPDFTIDLFFVDVH